MSLGGPSPCSRGILGAKASALPGPGAGSRRVWLREGRPLPPRPRPGSSPPAPGRPSPAEARAHLLLSWGRARPGPCYSSVPGLGPPILLQNPGAPAAVAQVPTAWAGMELPVVNLKVILLVHWLLTTWGCIVFSGSYAWANFTVLALGVWAVAQRDSVDAISMFLGGLLATIFLDIIYISVFYPLAATSDTGRFSAGMAIFSLLLKPLSCFLVYHMYRERGGDLLSHDFLRHSQEHSAYQTIDSPEPPADPFAVPEGRGQATQGY